MTDLLKKDLESTMSLSVEDAIKKLDKAMDFNAKDVIKNIESVFKIASGDKL